MSGTTIAGDEFRKKIADLLKTVFENVKEEFHLTGKNADIVFEMVIPPRTKVKVAVECKEWSTALTTRDFQNIETEYSTAFQRNEIHHLWIISPLDIRAMPRETIEAYRPKIEFMTFTQFEQFVLIDFEPYISKIIGYQ